MGDRLKEVPLSLKKSLANQPEIPNKCQVLFVFSRPKKKEKNKHGIILRHIILKNVSSQLVSACVSKRYLV